MWPCALVRPRKLWPCGLPWHVWGRLALRPRLLVASCLTCRRPLPHPAPRPRAQFYTDLLSEQLQDELEQQDQHSLLHFAWLMHKKTLVGVQRFEDLIHAKFEELVLLGFLKPRWQPHK